MGGFSFDDTLRLSDMNDDSVLPTDDVLRGGSLGLIERMPMTPPPPAVADD